MFNYGKGTDNYIIIIICKIIINRAGMIDYKSFGQITCQNYYSIYFLLKYKTLLLQILMIVSRKGTFERTIVCLELEF